MEEFPSLARRARKEPSKLATQSRRLGTHPAATATPTSLAVLAVSRQIFRHLVVGTTLLQRSAAQLGRQHTLLWPTPALRART